MNVAPRPFELSTEEIEAHLDELVEATFADLGSQFLVLPRSDAFVDFTAFQCAYEILKRRTSGFAEFTEATVWNALEEDALAFVVLRTILGMSPGEWADLARGERASDVDTGVARALDRTARARREYFAKLRMGTAGVTRRRAEALISVAVEYISRGAPRDTVDVVHRLDKIDTVEGLASLRHVASAHVPYAVVLHERFLGRPFASYRDAVSGLVGDVMESAIEEQLRRANVTFRKTRHAERIRGFDQAPDFIVPTELAPAVVIEAKVSGDDGTARDKVARILRLAQIRDERERTHAASFELVACIDGRGFGVRKQSMRDMIHATKGKVFTLASLDRLIANTRLKDFCSA